ncbi:MAG: bifunctional diaminohydroxyphosphoribosylaminopyrimidine deaminase/5-amino-6-(5-phosphoribosylamino)uracil reductase RibD [Frankiaceae bacterium]
MASSVETAAMRRALALAAAAAGSTSPNPPVGAVVLDAAGAVVGEGAHVGGPGHPHAEVVALAAAGDRAAGGTVVVTLEPCDHTGRTGPCTQALLAAGVARVVHALADPSEPAAGGGRALAAAGLDVEGGVLADEAAAVVEPWLHGLRTHRPFVTWKVAATLDGRCQAADGTSRWISSEASRSDAHALRARCDAIAVGVGTVLGDDPLLTVRGPDGTAAKRQPLRVVLDTAGRTPATARVLGPGCLVVTGAAVPVPAGAQALPVGAGGDGRVDLAAALRALHERGVRHLLLEGGPRLAGGFVAAGLVDEVVAYLAPSLLGAGAAAIEGAGVATVGLAHRLRFTDVHLVGPDLRIVARPLAAPVAGARPATDRVAVEVG